MGNAQHVHMIGIGGAGMSAIARILLASGARVSGSDQKESAAVEALSAAGAVTFVGHDPGNVETADLVVVSSAVPPENVELLEARRRRIPVMKRAEMLGRLMAGRYGIAVAGTHGKTTTTSMIALVLERAGHQPTFLIGGDLVELDTNARLGAGPYFIAEADEYDGSFLRLAPKMAVLTNIEPDHLDYYGTFDRLFEAFGSFLALVPPEGHIVACGDDLQVLRLIEQEVQQESQVAEDEIARAVIQEPLRKFRFKNVTTYGLGAGVDWRAEHIRQNALGGNDFVVTDKGIELGEFSLRIPGRHNIRNALAAIAVAAILDVDLESARRTLAGFRGARRRFELRGEVGGVTVVDDYGHHPTEIAVTLKAARERFDNRRLVVVFQPHTYSRTKHLLGEFAACFDQADRVIVTDIYAARERDTLGISSADLVRAMHHKDAAHIPDLQEASLRLIEELRPGDVLLTTGAGDVDKVAIEVLLGLQRRQELAEHDGSE